MKLQHVQWVLATAAAALLLLALQVVLSQSVRQGDARRADMARQTQAWSVCNRLHGRERRDSCRAGAAS